MKDFHVQTSNVSGKPGHVHAHGDYVCRLELTPCETQGKPLFKETSRMLCRGGKQVAPNASFAKALPQPSCPAQL